MYCNSKLFLCTTRNNSHRFPGSHQVKAVAGIASINGKLTTKTAESFRQCSAGIVANRASQNHERFPRDHLEFLDFSCPLLHAVLQFGTKNFPYSDIVKPFRQRLQLLGLERAQHDQESPGLSA